MTLVILASNFSPVFSWKRANSQINLKNVINKGKREIFEPILSLLVGNTYICIEIW